MREQQHDATPAGNTPAPEKGKPGAAAPEGKPEGLFYRPAPAAGYRLERHDSLTLQYPGGAVQQQVRDRIAFVHVTIGGTAGATSYPLTIVLDSLQALENGQPVDSAIIARGTRWTGSLGIDGELSQLQADRSGSLPDELGGRLRLLFPRLPATDVREGMEWTDSSEYKLVADAFPGKESQVTTYRVAEGSDSKNGVTLDEQRHIHPVGHATAGRPVARDDRHRRATRRASDQRRRRRHLGAG